MSESVWATYVGLVNVYLKSCCSVWKELPAEGAGTQKDMGTPLTDTINGQSMLAQMEER